MTLMRDQHFDSVAVGVVDFQKNAFQSFEISAQNVLSEKPYLYFDLASLTKALTSATIWLKSPELFDKNLLLLLNHKAGLPIGGRLSVPGWREQILSYDIKESPSLYSDYSSLRFMLEIEKKSGKKLKELCSYFFDKELVHWTELPENSFTPETGMRAGKVITHQVHDDNCFLIGEFISHAGLFSTIDGLARSLLNLEKQTNMIQKMTNAFKDQPKDDRFIFGFDRVMDLENTLAGQGCSAKTFGHLGFTGTSFWIDAEKKLGALILTNATQSYWHERSGLSLLRKNIGQQIWSGNI